MLKNCRREIIPKKAGADDRSLLRLNYCYGLVESPELTGRLAGAVFGVGVRKGVGDVRGEAVGLGRGVAEFVLTLLFETFALTFAFAVGDGLGEGDGLGFGVGVGVFKLAFRFVLTFVFIFVLALVLKSKLPIFRFVVVLVSMVGRFVFIFVFVAVGVSFCNIQKIPAPAPRTKIVPRIVSKTTFAVFDFGGGG